MEPKDAAKALLAMEHHEETLTARASGLTSMVWGIAVAAIFLGYQTLSGWAELNGAEWLDFVLWAPWVIMGTIVTKKIWASQSVNLSADEFKQGSSTAMKACFGVGIAAAALTILMAVVIDVAWNTHVVMLLVTAFMAAASAALQWKFLPQPAFFVAAIAASVIAVIMGTQGWDWEPSGFVAALAGGLTWFIPGYLTYARG